MATIYRDQHESLTNLLAMASKAEGATLLIPNLQRPYVWFPGQVVALVDSLIRGWPFGTLLTWKVRADDPARELARSFWSVVDRTDVDDGQQISMMHPPAAFHMVLDGQQRVQSLLLAFRGDGWGFKLLDRQWHEYLSGTRPRGRRGRPHWSLGCLCIDVPKLGEAYALSNKATAIDYSEVLCWVVTDGANGQSQLEKPTNYREPLPRSLDCPSQFVRLSRLWDAAPEQASIDPFQAEDKADKILLTHEFSKQARNDLKRPVAALIMALREVKQTRVTYLELAEYEEALGTRDDYNDAVVSIFTRLNTAGRTLTREDITFAWLKIGWDATCTESKDAKVCIDQFADELAELSVSVSTEDVISAISFVWSVSFNSGRLLDNADLIKGDAIRPMASDISKNWGLLTEAAMRVCEHAKQRGLKFREQYQSLNSLAYLWAWYFIAIGWRDAQQLKELEKDALEKRLASSLDSIIDRWLICSAWAGVWASGSSVNVKSYANSLAECARLASEARVIPAVMTVLEARIDIELKSIEPRAVDGLMSLNAYDRQAVRTYYTALWIWNRLEQDRWNQAKLVLRQRKAEATLEVDHIVACGLWDEKGEQYRAMHDQENVAYRLDIAFKVNEIGNCMLLEKNFNISKSKRSLRDFLEGVHEFESGQRRIEDWSTALDLTTEQVDSADQPVDILVKAISERSTRIYGDLEQFVRGTKSRIDVSSE